MTESLEIDKNKSLKPSQDYEFLREKGMEYIQSLSGKIWTDHNPHDPGITTLEVLCYAITDLGYRTDFSTQDLLTSSTGQPLSPEISSFFPAQDILTNTPLTPQDYRQLLLKIDGIKNAWLEPMMGSVVHKKTIPIYLDCIEEKLSFEKNNSENNANSSVELSGLYKVLLDLEIDDELGSLNESQLIYTIRTGELKNIQISLAYQEPQEVSDKELVNISSVSIGTEDNKTFSYKLKVKLKDTPGTTDLDLMVTIINDPRNPNSSPANKAEFRQLLNNSVDDPVVSLFWSKQQRIKKSLDSACCVLHSHRNLCEDFDDIRTISPDPIAVCADIEVENQADLELVQAQVYFEIEKYLNPPVKYYSLKELLEEGLNIDDIFNGPYLNYSFLCNGKAVFTKPGFIKRDEIDQSELRKVIYASDLINILMDIKNVVSIRNLSLRKYDANGTPIGESENWCLAITTDHQPIINIEKSKILFFKDDIPYNADRREFQNTLKHLRAMSQVEAYVGASEVLEIPRGTYRDTHQYFPIQHDFPKTYSIGEEKLPSTALPDRIAKAQQLKGYLTFFDQMLADYLAQMSSVSQIFSLDTNITKTYYSKYLTEIAGSMGIFEEEFYSEDSVLGDPEKRQKLYEDKFLFNNRRNRVLDHLIARFSEQFSDYVVMMHDLNNDNLKTDTSLIEDKIQFLKEYPIISRERNKAFNFLPENLEGIWDTNNISGLERRISRLAGISNSDRRNLTCEEVFEVLFDTRKTNLNFRLEIKDKNNQIIFKSKNKYNTRDIAMSTAQKVFNHLTKESSYIISDVEGNPDQKEYAIKVGNTEIINDQTFESNAEISKNIQSIIERHNEILGSSLCNEEGLFLFEHILFRPTSQNDPLMDICIDSDCEGCGDEDPYSFRISVVLPYWPDRFKNLDFRRFFERTLRNETPAHIHAKVCWIDNGQMRVLQQNYLSWLNAKSNKTPDPNEISQSLQDLLKTLQNLRTVYPAATLHDCRDDDNSTPVRLGNTHLGLF